MSDATRPERPRVPARRRVFVPLGTGLIAFVVASLFAPWQIAALIGWDVAAGVLIGWVWWSISRLGNEDTRRLARTEDDFEPAAHVVPIMASLASLVGAGFALLKASEESGLVEATVTALATTTVVLSWVAVNTAFTLRYARLYYADGGGLDFNENDEPDYRDFAYVAFTLGMTYQVSDTSVTSKEMRRTMLRHGLLSYVFGTAVVAVMINVVAGLVGS
jgi:uncharacterized membrane protein